MDRTTKQRLGLLAGLCAITLGGYALTQLPDRLAAQTSAPAAGTLPVATVTSPAPLAVVGGPVTLAATPDRKAVLRGGEGLVHVKIELSADTADGAKEARPTDMLVVLDVSGSMSGDKLAHAKQALDRLIERLNPSDRLALVTYESGAHTPIPFTVASAPNKVGFRRIVRQLSTGGGTNMSAGLDLALEALARSRRAGRPSVGQAVSAAGRTARVLLLSDGHANEGDATISGLARRARNIVQLEDVMSTMGVGDDFNEDLMTSLADTGTGNFYYLSRVETIGRFFDAELRAASETVARAVELRFAPQGGTSLVDMGGYPIAQGADHFTVRPGNLYGGQTRTLWATLRVPTAQGGALDPIPVGAFSVHYKRGEEAQQTPAMSLPTLACVGEQGAFDAAIVASVWEDYVAGEAYERAQAQLGAAVSEGNEADVDRVHHSYEQNRALAARLGSTRVLQQVQDMQVKSATAKEHQKKSVRERKYRGKQMKARSLFKRRADAYNDDPLSGML